MCLDGRRGIGLACSTDTPFVFFRFRGDSYSDVGYRGKSNSRPTLENPLGVPFPGLTWNESDQPNWVGHLLNKRDTDEPLLVFDYAIGGHTVDGIRQQVRLSYIKDIGAKPDWAQWTAHDALFGEKTCGTLRIIA